MFQLPNLPAWSSLHPLLIHFPIALLLIAPLFIVVAACLKPQQGRPFLFVAVVLLSIGTATLFLSLETGEAAAELVERGSLALEPVLKSHAAMASQTTYLFTGLTLVFGALFVLPQLFKRLNPRLFARTLPLLGLLLYGMGALSLIQTAHAGGQLVHQFGVHALMP